MKKFLKNTARFVVRNLILMVGLVLLGVWAFPQNFNPQPYFDTSHNNSPEIEMDYMMEEAPMEFMAKSSVQRNSRISMPNNQAFADVADEQRKVIKNASLNIEANDTDIAKDLVEEKVAELNGVVTNMNSYEVRSGVLAYNMTLRIPSGELDNALENIASLGIKKSENLSSNDITAQYQDTANQIANLEIRRERLRELMKFETDNLADVLQIDRELSNVQNQIENLERSQQRRDTDVDFSTVQLNIQPKTQIGDFSTPAEWNVEKTWKDSVNDLIGSLQKITAQAIRIAVYAPIWIPALIILWMIQRSIRRRTERPRMKKSSKKSDKKD